MTPPPPAPDDPARSARRTTAIRTAGAGLVCGAVATVLVGSGLWLTVAGAVAAAAAVGLGITALVRSGGLSPRRSLVAAGSAALVLGAFGLVTGGTRLALWPVAEAYEQCVSSTLTLSGGAQCREQLEDGIWSYLGGSGSPSAEDSAGASAPGAPSAATAAP
ncbi:hypothetical protein GCM10011374_01000 [Kocuria dechangensis]|uniref:Uncharacterized protein n=1 Tax=Kocuria dechangensis TaxID=1176249 RepID=A0A917GFD4_9MICC|nr:hypothetical protein [Kocuria dechangensis]GGG42450.1 hypothetical protein GCM10011374_01000 [Kocuria dechangensis]